MKAYVVVDAAGAVLERRFSAMDPHAPELRADMQARADLIPGSRWGLLEGRRTEDVEVVAEDFTELGASDPRILADESRVDTPHGPLRVDQVPARVSGFRAWRAHHPDVGFCGWVVRDARGRFQAHVPGAPPWVLTAGQEPLRPTLDDACAYLAGVAATRAEAKRS